MSVNREFTLTCPVGHGEYGADTRDEECPACADGQPPVEPRIVITGNPVDGFAYHGPFESEEEAQEWAENECQDDWWVAPLASPSEER